MRRLRSSDGVRVAIYDLGGRPDRPPALLVHATGFCAQVFARLAVHLAPAFHCFGVDLRGHGQAETPDAVDYAWTGFADDVMAAVAGLDLGTPVAIGHSSGGAAVLLAEARAPGTFASLWCYEPIIWPDPAAARGRAARLADGAARRRRQFATREEAYANFSTKPPLNVLAPASLRAYVEHGFRDEEDGSVVLRCSPDVEAAVYRHGAGNWLPFLPKVACPATVACGGRTDAITPAIGRQLAEALPAGRFEVFGRLGHFGPLEDPEQVGQAIRRDLGAGGV